MSSKKWTKKNPLHQNSNIWWCDLLPQVGQSQDGLFGTFPNLPVHALIHDPQKKMLQVSTRAHDPFFDTPKI